MKRLVYKLLMLTCVLSLSLPAATAGAAAPAPGSADAKGFEEFPLGDAKDVGPLNIAGVYFQPVDMEPAAPGSLPAAQADMHLEADIKAREGNNLGYGTGDFVPNLTVKYRVQKDGGNKLGGNRVIEGVFMPMNASDGPHYGNNVKLDGPGKYKITFIIENPEKQGWLLHVDKKTGVTGRYWTKPIEVSWDFDFVPRSW